MIMSPDRLQQSSVLSKPQLAADIAKQIADALQGIRFGSVEITIHDSRVVQVERKEKLRFDSKSTQ
jgi:hypothetical protein